jgi:thiamine pyrophosphokinase
VTTGVALVFAGGDPLPSALADRLPRDALVIGADSGVEHALALGRTVDLAVGDFDSIRPETLAAVERAGARIERHPPDKDASDLELALEVATREGARRVTVVGGRGGRLDHFVAGTLLLASERFAAVEVDAWLGADHITVVRRATELAGPSGSVVTLLAVGGPARGVTTTGLRFALTDAVLVPGSTLGLSNEITSSPATVALTSGVLLVVEPEVLLTLDAHDPRSDPHPNPANGAP